MAGPGSTARMTLMRLCPDGEEGAERGAAPLDRGQGEPAARGSGREPAVPDPGREDAARAVDERRGVRDRPVDAEPGGRSGRRAGGDRPDPRVRPGPLPGGARAGTGLSSTGSVG